MFTYGNWILFIIGIICSIIVGLWAGIAKSNRYNAKPGSGLKVGFFWGGLCVIICCALMVFEGWLHTNTAQGIRDMKDYHSNLSNGINREITITAEDGREIFHYEGKVDVETNPEKNYILFESEDGKRYIIYYGIQDTIKIIEK